MLADGDETYIQWLFNALDERFQCKDAEWLTPETPLDYLGMEVSIDKDRIYLSMTNYIEETLQLLDLDGLKPASTPIDKDIDIKSVPLPAQQRRTFMTAVGCLGWLVNTGRPDVAYAHSRVAQHMATPTTEAWEAVVRIFRYLKGAKNYALSACLHSTADDPEWQFYCDSDFAGNSEVQNKRRSQNGYVAIENGAPVQYGSKVSSVAFAHPTIGEAHADMSSGAAEIYAAANATFEAMHLSYVADEMGINFPSPIELQMDNTTAEAFINHTCFKSKLKHIDARQEWVKVLRSKDILKPVHVPTKHNAADLFTKILPRPDFERLRAMLMVCKQGSV